MAGQATDITLLAQATTTAAPAADASTAAPAAAAATEAASTTGAATPPAATAETHTAVGAHEAPVGFPPFNVATFGAQLLWLAICFGILYVVVARAVQPRLTSILAARRDKIDGDLAEADRLRAATDKAIADYEAALAAARAKANGIAQQTRDANKAELDGKRASVEADLAKKVGAAEAAILRAKTEALGKVDEIAADTAGALVARLTGAVSPDEARAAVASVVKG
jgi:F-type H+-transporting ATPase subunit b